MNLRAAAIALALVACLALGDGMVASAKTHHHHKKPHHAKIWINQAACVGEADAAAGNWSDAQQEFLLAEDTTKNLGATVVFTSLGLDAASVGLDQLDGAIPALTAHDISTFKHDLKKGGQWFKGCAK
ncbi:MAG: hypothetical protein ACRENX_07490 [Candidatus Dormibacteria bacterium]